MSDNIWIFFHFYAKTLTSKLPPFRLLKTSSQALRNLGLYPVFLLLEHDIPSNSCGRLVVLFPSLTWVFNYLYVCFTHSTCTIEKQVKLDFKVDSKVTLCIKPFDSGKLDILRKLVRKNSNSNTADLTASTKSGSDRITDRITDWITEKKKF